MVRYLTSHDEQQKLWEKHAMMPTRREFYDDPKYLQRRPGVAQLWKDLGAIAVARPSTVSGPHYDEVSRAYFSTMHAILADNVDPERALADLQQKLETIAGKKPNLPPAGAVQ